MTPHAPHTSHTPAATARLRTPAGRTARPLPGRPVRIDLTSLSRAGAGSGGGADPYGPLGAWMEEADGRRHDLRDTRRGYQRERRDPEQQTDSDHRSSPSLMTERFWPLF